MHILVVDDEALARQRLLRLLDSIDNVTVVGEAVNGREALQRVEELDPDLVLLDIRMPGEDGLSIAHKLTQLDDPPAIVFCTAYDEYAIEAFGTLAVGYLLKPVQRSHLQEVIKQTTHLNKIQRSSILSTTQEKPQEIAQEIAQDTNREALQNERKHISTNTRRGIELIPIDSISCFVADQKYVTIYHNKGESLTDETLKELESSLSKHFTRAHRNALVATRYIEGLERKASGTVLLRLKGTPYQPIVSRRHLPEIKTLLSQL